MSSLPPPVPPGLPFGTYMNVFGVRETNVNTPDAASTINELELLFREALSKQAEAARVRDETAQIYMEVLGLDEDVAESRLTLIEYLGAYEFKKPAKFEVDFDVATTASRKFREALLDLPGFSGKYGVSSTASSSSSSHSSSSSSASSSSSSTAASKKPVGKSPWRGSAPCEKECALCTAYGKIADGKPGVCYCFRCHK